jgi:cell division protein ZapA
MAEVNLIIHGRTYGVGCDDGQEKRVRELGQYIDKRVKEIAGAGGAATEAHLLVLTSLVLADEIFETREGSQTNRSQTQQLTQTIEALEQQLGDQQQSIQNLQRQLDEQKKSAAAAIANARAAAEQTANSNTDALDPETEAQITAAIETLAGRLDSIAKRLQAA